MTLAEVKARLVEIRAAISAVKEGNQSYSTPDGTTNARADYRTLLSEERRFEQQEAALEGGYGATEFTFSGRR